MGSPRQAELTRNQPLADNFEFLLLFAIHYPIIGEIVYLILEKVKLVRNK